MIWYDISYRSVAVWVHRVTVR